MAYCSSAGATSATFSRFHLRRDVLEQIQRDGIAPAVDAAPLFPSIRGRWHNLSKMRAQNER
jgi:hypothetical protein